MQLVEIVRETAERLRAKIEAPIRMMIEGRPVIPVAPLDVAVLLAAAETLLERLEREVPQHALTPEQDRLRQLIEEWSTRSSG